MSLCVSRSHRIRIVIRTFSSHLHLGTMTRGALFGLVAWAYDLWRKKIKSSQKKGGKLPIHCHGHREPEKPHHRLRLHRGCARHFTHRHTHYGSFVFVPLFFSRNKQIQTLIECGGWQWRSFMGSLHLFPDSYMQRFSPSKTIMYYWNRDSWHSVA